MIPAWLTAWMATKGVAVLKEVASFVAMLGVLCVAVAVGAGVANIAAERMVETARAEAIKGRDAHWRAEIEASNAAVERARADQIAASLAAQTRAQGEIDAARQTLKDMEAANAALPDRDRCALGRARVRLLTR